MSEILKTYNSLKTQALVHRLEDYKREVEMNIPIVEGSTTIEEMRDLTATLLKILTTKGMPEKDAKVLISTYTTNANLLEILDVDSQTQITKN